MEDWPKETTFTELRKPTEGAVYQYNFRVDNEGIESSKDWR